MRILIINPFGDVLINVKVPAPSDFDDVGMVLIGEFYPTSRIARAERGHVLHQMYAMTDEEYEKNENGLAGWQDWRNDDLHSEELPGLWDRADLVGGLTDV